MNQTLEVRFKWRNEKTLKLRDVRQIAGSAFADEFPWAFHKDDQGEPLNGIPLVRWRTCQNGFGILIADPQYQAFAFDLAKAGSERFTLDGARPLSIESLSHETNITVVPYKENYKLTSVVVSGKLPTLKRLIALKDAGKLDDFNAEIAERMKALLKRDLLRQAYLMGSESEVESALDFCDIDITPQAAGLAVIHEGTRGKRTIKRTGLVASASLKTNLNIQGSWAIGAAQNRGFGAIVRNYHA